MNLIERFSKYLNGPTVPPAPTTEKRGGYEVVFQAINENRANAHGFITPDSSLSQAAVWACVRVLSETLASLPLFTYERTEKGKRRATEHELYSVLHDQANPQMTAFAFRETMMGHLALWGNAYAQIIYDGRGRIVELWPLRPDKVLQSQMEAGRRWYRYQNAAGGTDWYSQDEIWHIPGLGGDGMDGYSPIGLMRRSIGLSMSAEEFGARFFENDARPGIVLEHPGRLSETANKNLRTSWAEQHEGVENSHKPAILEEGMKLHEIGIPPEDAQFLETRRFQVSEIARIFRIPPHMIGDLDQATFSNIEQQSLEFVMYTIRPWLVRWEQSIMSNLMLDRDRPKFYTEFLVDGLLRGDTASRYSAYAVGRQNGWLSANDIRGMENMDTIDGGDVYLVPLNMVPADQAGMAPQPGGSPSTAGSRSAASASLRVPEAGPLQSETRAANYEQRAIRSANSRLRLSQAQVGVIQDVAERAMRRETHDVSEAIHKYLGKRDSGQLLIWMDEFYSEHQAWMERQYLPVLQAYGKMIAYDVTEEIDRDIEDLQGIVQRFMDSYAASFAAAQVGISLYRIKAAMTAAAQQGVDLESALNDEMTRWQDSRPEEIAKDQSVRAGSAMAKTLYAAAGMTTLTWRSMGEACPFCQAMDGRNTSITKSFLPNGEHLIVEGSGTLVAGSNIGHPPLHGGCTCMITAG